jgi:hypothetical protein
MKMEDLKKKIEDLVKTNKLVIFMKGTPEAPRCGFSNQAVQVLKTLNQPLKAVDVLSDDSLWGASRNTPRLTVPRSSWRRVRRRLRYRDGADNGANCKTSGEMTGRGGVSCPMHIHSYHEKYAFRSSDRESPQPASLSETTRNR